MLLLCLGTGVGVTDRHSQCAHWLRNDTGPYMGCGGAGDRKGRPYGGHGGVVGRRATARVAPTEGTVVRWDGGRPQGSPLRGRMHPVKMPRRVCRLRAAKLCARQTRSLLAENRRFFARDDKRTVPDRDSPFESVKRVYCAALAALMDSISSGTTLNRSPTIP